MSVKTRGSAALDKAQRRLALLKSINENLDLGHGLTIEAYSRYINDTRATLEAHNTLLSNLDESRKTMDLKDKGLSELSERMLSAVASIYGRNSIEYLKAGGSNRNRSKSKKSITQAPSVVAISSNESTPIITNGKGSLSNI
ncbi:hypothetical protein VF14_24185 [Nostoc linckia z18]|uniref:Uncharacterized protein n=2 Tax=Nostoc linckia TaxID=92942 RepID=A0A9Q5Z713_NOSLI|nr:hypothetical protein [Nostoc linckia]PHK38282.1 hypothetical protein VF12_18690 [Nostoc linckia z15]PHK42831.1 hypothetical protein VF13_28985 [Nostoc linckia z16]PHJ56639.1 hypothetical protein VF02_32420 [Nostoc linckia z1]PHJ58572.1 hypothetical protein VF05_33670 [Nostoc linckia z3]PHJ72376.1 hypothetical protein VF03_18785 [Nostoc linckia z2]